MIHERLRPSRGKLGTAPRLKNRLSRLSTATEILVSIAAVAALFLLISSLVSSIRNRYVAARDLLRSFDERLGQAQRDLKRIRAIAEDSELPENERRDRARARAFEDAREFNLPFLRNLPTGSTVRVISRPWQHASEAVVLEFDYRHERVEEGAATRLGKRVHGSSRSSESDEWSPYMFFANDAQATTSSGSEQLRRRLR